MILPTKHLSVDESILGAGAAILKELSSPKSVSRLWDQVRSDPRIGNFKRFTLILTFLFAIDAIAYKEHLISKRTRR